MRVVSNSFARVTLALALIGCPTATFAATSAALHVQNNEPGTINLSSQTPGTCGTWFAAIAPAPPASVAASSTSAAFFLNVSVCQTVNHASMTYTYTNGELVSQCTYTIDGTFTYGASGVQGCKVIYPPDGTIIFVFPDTDAAHTRNVPHRIH